jgi:hypothetical protein
MGLHIDKVIYIYGPADDSDAATQIAVFRLRFYGCVFRYFGIIKTVYAVFQ